MTISDVQYPGPVCSLNHRSPPGAVTTGYPGLHGLGGIILDVRLWHQCGTGRGKKTMRGPITQPPTSTTCLFLRRRRRLRFVFSMVSSCPEEMELVGDKGEGVRVRESLCGLASSSECASPSWGTSSDSLCVVLGHRSRSKAFSSQGKHAICSSRGVGGREGVGRPVVE
jgi:hypothetical protein